MSTSLDAALVAVLAEARSREGSTFSAVALAADGSTEEWSSGFSGVVTISGQARSAGVLAGHGNNVVEVREAYPA